MSSSAEWVGRHVTVLLGAAVGQTSADRHRQLGGRDALVRFERRARAHQPLQPVGTDAGRTDGPRGAGRQRQQYVVV